MLLLNLSELKQLEAAQRDRKTALVITGICAALATILFVSEPYFRDIHVGYTIAAYVGAGAFSLGTLIFLVDALRLQRIVSSYHRTSFIRTINDAASKKSE